MQLGFVAILCVIYLLHRIGGTDATDLATSWCSISPSEAGFDGAKLGELRDKIFGYSITASPSAMVIRHGCIVKAWGRDYKLNQWHSATKTVLSTLLLFALKEGRIDSVDDRIMDLGFDLKRQHEGMTFRHLANMTSGYGRPEASGEAFSYNDYAIKLYYLSLEKVFETKPLLNVFKTRIAVPLGFEDDVQGLGDGRFKVGHKMRMSARDWARIHLFWLNKFKWEDKQLLPCEYFAEYIKPQVPRDLPRSRPQDTSDDDYLKIDSAGGNTNLWAYTQYGPGMYGFNFWFNKKPVSRGSVAWPALTKDSFLSIGSRGNVSTVIPEHQLILVSGRGPWNLDLDAGNPKSQYNQIFTLLMEALVAPAAGRSTAPPMHRDGCGQIVESQHNPGTPSSADLLTH